jgi:hypothetical protein
MSNITKRAPTRIFQEEYRELPRKYGAPFDEEHVWD